MKSVTFTGILCPIFVCISLVSSVINADVINVPGDYDTIGRAARFADGGDTILVAPGVYENEGIWVTPVNMKNPGGITLQGAGRSVTTIIGGIDIGGGAVKETFKVDGFRIEGTLQIRAMSMIVSNNFVTHHPSSRRPTGGIKLDYPISGRVKVVDNIIRNSEDGLWCIGHSDEDGFEEGEILIARNVIENNNEYGLYCRYNSPEVRENRIVGNKWGLRIAGSSSKPDLGTRKDPGKNTIYGNSEYDIKNNADGIISAKYNYWGSSDGPEKGGISIINSGDGWVDYEPWLARDETVQYSVQPKKKMLISWGLIKIEQR